MTVSIEIPTGCYINKGLRHVVRISLGTPVGGLNIGIELGNTFNLLKIDLL